MDRIKIFNTACSYFNNEILIFGCYKNIKYITLCECYISNTNDVIKSEIKFYKHIPLFCIKLFGDINDFINKDFHFIFNKSINIENIQFYFPFENKLLYLEQNTSNIISTMCKNYNHRLDEWIQYNLKLGFDAIIIFNNEENISNNNNVNDDYYENMNVVTDKYKDNVLVIDFPYSPFHGNHWNTLQNIVINISVNAFRNKCKYITLIDADEFIYLPNLQNNIIKEFSLAYDDTICMKSNILTNKSNNDNIDNNILSICKYVGINKNTKIMLRTTKTGFFVRSVHDYPKQLLLPKKIIRFYHCWVNNRFKYNNKMGKLENLEDFYKKSSI